MSKSLKKLLISVIAVAMCFTFAIAMNGIKNVSATTIETFDMSTASVRLVEPTGIRFTTEVNKTYRDTTLSGKDYSFGTLIIPVDVYEKSGAQELTHSVDDVMVVSQQTWGKDVNGNYAFNAVLKNIPSTEYGRELMARSFVTIDGVTTYSVTTLTKSIGQVASETLAEIPEIEEGKELLDAYVNGSVKSVAFAEESIELAINETMALSATTNPANYAVVYSVDDETVVSFENGVVKGLKTGSATITATVGNYTDTIEVTVSDAYLETLDGFTTLGSWVSNDSTTNKTATRELVVEENGNKYAKFTVPASAFITFNIDIPSQLKVLGKDYIVTFDLWSNDTLNSTLAVTFPNGMGDSTYASPVIAIDGHLNSSISETTASMRFEVASDLRLRTFRIYNSCSTAVDFCIDNVKFTPVKDAYMNLTKGSSILVDANTLVNINAETLGINHIAGDISYKVEYNGSDEIELVEGALTTAKFGYYDVYATVTNGASSVTKLINLVVKGTYHYSLNNVTNIASGADWFVRNSSSGGSTAIEIITESNGDKYYKFSAVTGEKTTFNMPLPTQSGLTLTAGKNYVAFIELWTDTNLTGSQYIEFTTASSGVTNATGKLVAGKNKCIISMDYYHEKADSRFSTFYITNGTGAAVTYCIDNITLVEKNVVRESGDGYVTTNANGNIVLVNSVAWSKYRFYLDGLENYSAGDTVKVTMKYKTVGASAANNQCYIFYGTNDGLEKGNLSLVKDSDFVTTEFNAMVYTGVNEYPANAVISGALGKHIKITTLFTSTGGVAVPGVQIVIESITISAA